MTATVETVAEQLDLVSIMPAEKVVTAITRSVTLNETDNGNLSEIFWESLKRKKYNLSLINSVGGSAFKTCIIGKN